MNNEIYQPKCGRLVDINFNVFTALFPSRHRDDRLSRQVTEFVTFLGERFVKLEGFDDRWFNVRHVQPHYAVGDTVHFKREYWDRHFAYLRPSEMGKRYFSLSARVQLEATPECNVTSSMPFVIEKIVHDCDDCSEDNISLKGFDRDVFSAHDVVSHDEPDGPYTPGETVQIDDPEQHIRGIYAIYDCSAGEVVINGSEDSGVSRKYFVNVDRIVRCIPRNHAPGEEFSLDGLESVTLKSLHATRFLSLTEQTYPVVFTFPDGRKQSIVINVEGFPFITSSDEVAVAHHKQFSLSSASPVAVGSIVHVKDTPASINYVVVKQLSARSIFVRSVEPVNGVTVMTIVSVEDVEPAQPKLPFEEERAAFCRAINTCAEQGFLNTNGQRDKFIEEVSHVIDENLKVLLRTVSPSAKVVTDLATIEFPQYGLKVTLTYDTGSVFPALVEAPTQSLPQRLTEDAFGTAAGRAQIIKNFLFAMTK